MAYGGRYDVLEPLAPYKDHHFYPSARAVVLNVRRTSGAFLAMAEAQLIAEKFEDMMLLKGIE